MCSEVSVTWNEHQSTIVQVFEKLLESSTLVDCTIAAEGQYLKAHKIILSACSPYFEMLFRQESEKNPIVVLKDIKFEELEALVEFMYSGKVIVPQKHLGNFVDAAKTLQIKGIGGVNRRTNFQSSELAPTEYSVIHHNEEEHAPPYPHKRSRYFYTNNNGNNVRRVSSVMDLNVETTTNKEFQSCETHLDAPSSNEVDLCPPPLTSLSDNTNPSEQENLETKESISLMEEPILPESEQLPNGDAVVKNEPEEIAEVSFPEIDCFVEPKETALDSASEEKISVMGDSQPGSSQYSALPTVLQDSSSAGTATDVGRPDNLLLVTDVRESFSIQGAVMPFSDAAFINLDNVSTRCTVTAPTPAASARKVGSSTAHVTVPVHAVLDKRRIPRGKRKGVPGSSKLIHSCSICGKEFGFSSLLQRHFKIHTGDRQFKCQMCGKAFFDNFQLRVHLRIHTGEKPFECRQCGSAFRQLSTLRRHLLSHTGERPHKCDQCFYTSAYRHDLMKHIRKWHSSTPE